MKRPLRTTTGAPRTGRWLRLANQQSWRTAWRARSLPSRTSRSGRPRDPSSLALSANRTAADVFRRAAVAVLATASTPESPLIPLGDDGDHVESCSSHEELRDLRADLPAAGERHSQRLSLASSGLR